jgi:hypothetical protein
MYSSLESVFEETPLFIKSPLVCSILSRFVATTVAVVSIRLRWSKDVKSLENEKKGTIRSLEEAPWDFQIHFFLLFK